MRQYAKVFSGLDSWERQTKFAPFEKYVGGDDVALPAIRPDDGGWSPPLTRLCDELPPIDQLDDRDLRVLRGLLRCKSRRLSHYLDLQLSREPLPQGTFALLHALATQAQLEADAVCFELAYPLPKLLPDGNLNSAGAFVLGLSDAALAARYAPARSSLGDLDRLCAYLARSAPERLRSLAPVLARDTVPDYWEPSVRAGGAVVGQGGAAVAGVLAAFGQGEQSDQRLHTLFALLHHGHREHAPEAFALAVHQMHALAAEQYGRHEVALMIQMMRAFGPQSLAPICELLADRERKLHWDHHYQDVPGAAAEALGEPGLRALCEVLSSSWHPLPRVAAIKALIACGSDSARVFARELLLATIPWLAERKAAGDPLGVDYSSMPEYAARFTEERWSEPQKEAIQLCGALKDPALAPLVAGALEQGTDGMRAAAARVYAQLAGNDAIALARELLAERGAARRKAGLHVLIALRNEAAFAVLQEHEPRENDQALRTLLMAVLVPRWRAQGAALGLERVQPWVDGAKKVLAKPPAPWFSAAELPQLKLTSGAALDPQTTSWLCHRQAQSSDMTLDPEASVLVALLDRAAGAQWATALWTTWQATGMNAREKWVLALTSALSDGREAQAIYEQALRWADKGRGGMAEHAAHALARIADPRALMLVDDMSARFASRNRNVGSAASEAFAQAAQARGISVDELGDLVVPRLGFRQRTRQLQCGDKTVELGIGLDGKPSYRDPARGTAIKSLPKGASKELKAELKQLGVDLRQAVKTQRLRHERMLITQRRWPTEAWRALYGEHPLLAPFAVQLVWAQYDQAGAVARSFRMLEDGSFTDAADDALQLDPALRVGIAHPLELDEAARSAWQDHLADHEVQPPFEQLERSVHRLAASEASERVLRTVEDVKLAAGTFRGRAEKRGWTRGSVGDGGWIHSYVRRFPGPASTCCSTSRTC